MSLDKHFVIIFVGIIILVSIIFSVLYYINLYVRYYKTRHLILKQEYLSQLFKQVESDTQASQDTNGDIDIGTVTFMQKDFQFSQELHKITDFFNQNLDWEYKYDRRKI